MEYVKRLQGKGRKRFLTRQEAQEMAKEHILNLCYGLELKDYFWINDMHPYFIMHPYRTDLDGKDITTFSDLNGNIYLLNLLKPFRNTGQAMLIINGSGKMNQTGLYLKFHL